MRRRTRALAGLCAAFIGITSHVAAQPARPSPVRQVMIRRDQLSDAVRAQIDSGKARVLSATGISDKLAATAPATSAAPGRQPLKVDAGSLVIARTDTVARPVDSATRQEILGGDRAPASSGTGDVKVSEIPIDIVAPTGTNGRVQAWRPYVVFPDRLRLQKDGRATGQVLVGLRNMSGDSPLTSRVGLSIVTDADVEPGLVVFTGGDADPKRVTVSSALGTQPVVLRVHANGSPDDDVRVSLNLPSVLRFENPPTSVQALGLERRRVLLRVLGAPLTDSVTVTFSAGSNDVEPAMARLGPGGVAEVTIIADAIGPLTLTASAPGTIDAETNIEGTTPVRFSLALLFGALLGGLYIHLTRKRVPGAMLRRFAFSVLGGVIIAAVWIGLSVNLTMLPIDRVAVSTIAVFAFAAIGGVSGATLGERLGLRNSGGTGGGGGGAPTAPSAPSAPDSATSIGPG